MEPEHRKVVRERLAKLLGRTLERVGEDATLADLVLNRAHLQSVIERLQQEFRVSLARDSLREARTVNHIVTLVSDAAREARRVKARGGPAAAASAARALEAPVAGVGQDASPPAAASDAAAPTSPSLPAVELVYQSPTPYSEARIGAAAVYCSDGRIGDQVDEFLHHGLGLPRYDRVVAPGGPVTLASRLLAFWEGRGVESQLRFLVEAHGLQQVVLIAHEGCAYYRERLKAPASSVTALQLEDLARAATLVRRLGGDLKASAYFAHIRGASVGFERIEA